MFFVGSAANKSACAATVARVVPSAGGTTWAIADASGEADSKSSYALFSGRVGPLNVGGGCIEGYFTCSECCDVNSDCSCDQICDTSTAPNGVCSTPLNSGSAHCGGNNVDPLADGTAYGWSDGTVEECMAKCTADPTCNAFVRRDSDSACHWKSGVSAETMDLDYAGAGHSCYLHGGGAGSTDCYVVVTQGDAVPEAGPETVVGLHASLGEDHVGWAPPW
jgi:hypothetical protein